MTLSQCYLSGNRSSLGASATLAEQILYPIVYRDGIPVKVHQDKRVINKAVYVQQFSVKS